MENQLQNINNNSSYTSPKTRVNAVNDINIGLIDDSHSNKRYIGSNHGGSSSSSGMNDLNNNTGNSNSKNQHHHYSEDENEEENYEDYNSNEDEAYDTCNKHHEQQHIVDFNQLKNSTYSPQIKNYWKSRLNSGLASIVFLECLFVFTYVIYVYTFASQYNNSKVASSVILLIYHIIMFLVQFSLFRTTFTDPGGIPDGFPNSIFSESENLLYETNSQGLKRKCSKCQKMKPDRAHHCSKCKRCVLKMDHHCPFVNNCVGYFNYKYFVLFLLWTSILCFYVVGTTLQSFMDLLNRHDENVFAGVLFVIALIFGLGLSVFTMTHISYVVKNVTTIEHLEKKLRFNRQSTTKNSLYDKGFYHNWCQVFGYSAAKWFLPLPPTYTMSSGMIYPVNCSEDSPLMGNF